MAPPIRQPPWLGCSARLAPAEARAVDPHAMQHRGQLAGERHLGALHAASPGDSSAQRFRLENRAVRLSITLAASYSAVRTIASPALADPAGDVGLAGLVLLWRQPEVSAHVLSTW